MSTAINSDLSIFFYAFICLGPGIQPLHLTPIMPERPRFFVVSQTTDVNTPKNIPLVSQHRHVATALTLFYPYTEGTEGTGKYTLNLPFLLFYIPAAYRHKLRSSAIKTSALEWQR